MPENDTIYHLILIQSHKSAHIL